MVVEQKFSPKVCPFVALWGSCTTMVKPASKRNLSLGIWQSFPSCGLFDQSLFSLLLSWICSTEALPKAIKSKAPACRPHWRAMNHLVSSSSPPAPPWLGSRTGRGALSRPTNRASDTALGCQTNNKLWYSQTLSLTHTCTDKQVDLQHTPHIH